MLLLVVLIEKADAYLRDDAMNIVKYSIMSSDVCEALYIVHIQQVDVDTWCSVVCRDDYVL